nr:MAG TPA: hypothetical protein [Caudoviricetes sp.]
MWFKNDLVQQKIMNLLFSLINANWMTKQYGQAEMEK